LDVFRKKPVADLLAQDSARGPGLRKRLGPVDPMGIGVVIGTGLFTRTGMEAKNHAARPW